MRTRLLADGQRIGQNYTVERYLGEGAFAEVYRVRHRFFGRQAMKVFKNIGTVEDTEEMLGEAILLSRIGHPNIVRVFDADTVTTASGQSGFFTMEYVAGGTLQDYWRSHRDRLVPVDATVQIISQICEGLAVAHAEDPPIVHRDITPRNVLVGYDPRGLRARISDFGLAKRADPYTGLVSAKGTLAFKPPESLTGSRIDSRAGDVWAIGTIAYLLLTDSLPFEDSAGPLSFMVTPPRPPQKINSDVDDQLGDIVLRALQPNSKDRTQDAAELAAQLAGWRDGARSRPPAAPARRSARTQTSKQVLGTPPPTDDSGGLRLASQALELARQAATLAEAADLMEEAFNRSAELRARYEDRLTLWRKGIVS